MHVQEAIGSRSSAIHNDYRTSLRPSQVLEPRYPSLKIVLFYFLIHSLATTNIVMSSGRSKGTNDDEQYPETTLTAQPRIRPLAHSFHLRRQRHASSRIQQGSRFELDSANDPSAGSPTETLLRLLLPLSDKVHETFQRNVQKLSTASVRIIHRITQSVGATGGVYKGQGRNQHELMTRAY